MSWSPVELTAVGGEDELRLASYRADGTLRPWVIIWVARAGDELFVRTAHHDPDTSAWYRHALTSGRGRIMAGGVERDVAFEHAADADQDAVDAAYHAKYDRYGATTVGSVVGPAVHDLTIRLVAA